MVCCYIWTNRSYKTYFQVCRHDIEYHQRLKSIHYTAFIILINVVIIGSYSGTLANMPLSLHVPWFTWLEVLKEQKQLKLSCLNEALEKGVGF